MERYLLVHVSGFLLGALFLLVAVGLAVGGLVVVRRNVALSTLESHNDVAGFIIAVIGVLYAVMLAFVVIIVWEQFESASRNADHEASLVLSLYRNVAAFPSASHQLRQDIHQYAQSVADDEWRSMNLHQNESDATDNHLGRLYTDFQSVRPANTTEDSFFQESVKQLNEIQQSRRERVFSSNAELPTALWFVLVAGAAVTIGFTYFFGVANLRAHMLMVVALASIIGLILFLIVSLDLPFTGNLAVKASAMHDAIKEFADIGP